MASRDVLRLLSARCPAEQSVRRVAALRTSLRNHGARGVLSLAGQVT